MKKFGFLLLFTFPLTLLSQVDSLLNLLNTLPQDTQQVLLLDELGWQLKQDAPDSARLFLRQAISLSEKLEYLTGQSKAWNDLGVVETIHAQYDQALEAYNRALKVRQQLGVKKDIASVYNNLANVLDQKGDFVEALNHYQRSLRVASEIGDSSRIARVYYNMGDLHERIGNYPEALDFTLKALFIFEKTGDEVRQAFAHNLLGNVHFELNNYQEATFWYQKALQLYTSLEMDWERATVLNNLASIKGDLAENLVDEKKYEEAKLVFDTAMQMVQEVIELRGRLEDKKGIGAARYNIGVFYKDRGSMYRDLGNPAQMNKDWNTALSHFQESLDLRTAIDDKKGIIESWNGFGDIYRRKGQYQKALDYTSRYLQLAEEIKDDKLIMNATKDLSKIYQLLGNYQLAFQYAKDFNEQRENWYEQSWLKDFDRRQQFFRNQQKEFELERQQQQNELLDAQLKQQEAEIKQAAIFRNSLIGGALALILLAALLYNRNRIKTKANLELEQKNQIIDKERQRSDELLLNILPEETAQELKTSGKAKARKYDQVSVLFSDFKSFTTIAAKLSPEALVEELDICFKAFDDITRNHGVEKIKTIGDAYMCVSGLPQTCEDHAVRLMEAAKEMLAFLEKRRSTHPDTFEMRIGIHSGPVVAGIVGSRKFAYDIWGDTVNLAARMEQNSHPGRINVSQATYLLCKDQYTFEPRGAIEAKNAGSLNMYFLTNKK